MRPRPEARPLHGLLVLDKPAGPSSNQALQRLRRALGGVKAGHAGTLDPGVRGVLLVGLGEGAKLTPFLADLEKEYRGVARFGAETDTQDGSGVETARAGTGHLTEGLVREAMAEFVGEGLQEPPMFSAVKVGGQRLYRLARAGEEVARAPRRIMVSAFDLLSWNPPDAGFQVRCSSGTYVRTLCRDLGRRCASAAHLASLVRTAVGSFRLEDAATLEELEALPRGAPPPGLVRLGAALGHLPRLVLDGETARNVLHGRPPPPPRLETAAIAPGGTLRLTDGGGRLLAVARFLRAGSPLEILRVFNEP